jgi:uncharacterized protein with HEPN domain
MSKHDPTVTLRQIAECARRAQELCSARTLDELQADWRNALAFERVMEVLGEAVKRLPAELRDRYPAVPWKLVAGMRDRVSHGYDAIDHQTLWDAVQQDGPTLLVTVEQMLKEIEATPGQ